jgi:hypothetical protein
MKKCSKRTARRELRQKRPVPCQDYYAPCSLNGITGEHLLKSSEAGHAHDSLGKGGLIGKIVLVANR